MAGFGNMSFGSGPFGLGTPVTGEDPPTGAAGCRYINPASRDYQQDPDTLQLAQMPEVRQRVLLALTTLVGSSTVLRDFGVRLPGKMGTTFIAEARNAVRVALRQLTDVERIARIDSIDVLRGSGGRARITVSYTDLQTLNSEQVIV